MSADAEARAVPTRAAPDHLLVAAGAAIVAAGSMMLLARPFVGLGADARAALFAASYVAVASASISYPVDARVSRRSTDATVWLPLSIGVGAVVAVSVTGTAVPIPATVLALPLSVIAAVAEEALFRRVAYARLERFGPAIAIAVTAALFGLIHLPTYGTTALPVDLSAGLLFGWQRWASGTWTVPASTHALANILASL
ncbi:MAG TPA: CPBP family intramembrane glutamic endopeptidase [Actinomycetota bacterium]|nr:CPBP family intramembrane glutamic endopeptidase [Actinomycetota bacterium]